MASQGFTEDLKHVLRDSVTGMRERIGEPRPMTIKIGACAAGVAVLAGALALRGEARPISHRPLVRSSSPVTLDGSLPARGASKSYVAGSSEESHGQYKAAAQSYALAARKGDKRGISKLLAMTRAPNCEARSEAADALAGFRSKKTTAALKKLAASTFRDEAKSPGIFSCSSRRSAQKALEEQRRK
jgi:hypothetical protein